METVTIKVNKAKAEEIMAFYDVKQLNDPKHPYDLFHVKTIDGILVDGYRSKNENTFTIVFKGNIDKISMEASIFIKDPNKIVKNSTGEFDDYGEQIGSDEVGVGDFFGPMIVTASYYTKDEINILKKLIVKDSKKLTDAHMLHIGKELSASIKHYTVLCSPERVSLYVNNGYSTHWILAKLHNLAQKKLIEKYNIPEDVIVYIDQFERETIYRKYVGEDIIQNPIIFKTKGESHYPSVAVSSVIARYEFLKYWEKMESVFGMTIPKGAGVEVDKIFKILIEKEGLDKVKKYTKTFFRNFKDVEPA